MEFKLQAEFKPSGDQPQAIEALVNGIEKKYKYQVLLGITGSGKTFAMANVVQKLQRPTLVIAHIIRLQLNFTTNSKPSFQKMQSSILSAIMIITSLKLTFRAVTYISKKILRLMII